MTPDVRALARIYLHDPDLTQRLFERDQRAGYEMHHPVDVVRRVFQDSGHADGYLWDAASLRTELGDAGFADVRVFRAGETEDPVFADLDTRGGDDPVAQILFAAEAERH